MILFLFGSLSLLINLKLNYLTLIYLCVIGHLDEQYLLMKLKINI